MMRFPDQAFQSHVAILGKTGSGKTSTAKSAIVEPLLESGAQVCVIDPTSAWWGLRLAADGKGKGFDRVILLGGERGDIQLSERSGDAVARLVTEQDASCVIDTGHMTVGEYTRWFIAFATALFTTIKAPLHLVIDEAHHFMPQGKSPDVDAGRMLHAGNRLMSGGRSRGIRGTLITQRPAKLHKDSLTCADTLIAHRVIAPQDRAAIKDWIDGAGDPAQGKAVLESLASLGKGEAWVWYPEGGFLNRMQFPMPKTFDSSKAPTAGGRAPKVAEIDLSAVEAAMAQAVKEAEANDPKALHRRIAELERQLKAKPAPVAQVKPVEVRVEVPVLKNGQLDRTEKIIGRLEDVGQKALAEAGELKRLIGPAFARAPALAGAPRRPAAPMHVPAASVHKEAAPANKPAAAVHNDGTITPRQQRFLNAAATLQTLNAEVSRETVCGWVGVHPRGGSVGEELKALAEAGLIEMDRGRIVVTESGELAAEVQDASQAIEQAKSGLSPRQARIFAIVVEAHPEMVSRDSVAASMQIHPRGGSFGEDIARLRGRGLIEVNRGELKARDFLFAR